MDGIVNISNPRGFKFCIYLNTKISMPHEQTINNASNHHSSLAQNTRNINMNVCIEKYSFVKILVFKTSLERRPVYI